MNRINLLWLCVSVAALTSCLSTPQNSEPEQPPGGGSVTLWTDHTELFMEYPALLVGKEARFAVHLTWMDTFKPVSEGTLDLLFRSGDGVTRATRAPAPSSPGIYRPAVLFDRPGIYDLTMIIEGTRADTIHVRAIPVYASVEDIPEEEESGGEEEIVFLKEQQWNIDFRTEVVKTETLGEQINAHGEIIPRLRSEVIISAPFTGIVFSNESRELPIIGSLVSKGSRLATLTPAAQSVDDGADFATRYAQAEHERFLAAADFERMTRLYDREAIPLKRVQEAQTRLKDAETTLATLNSHVQRSSGNDAGVADRFFITAPIGGTVVETHVIPGKQLTTGAPMFRIIDMERVWIRVYAPVTEIGRLQTAYDASFDIPGFDERFALEALDGRLVSSGSVVENQTRSIPIIYEVRNPKGQFRIGMFLEARIAAGTRRETPAIPETALIEDEGRYFVFVQTSGEGFARRAVQTGARDRGLVEITDGLTVGEHVVTVGAYQVRLASMSTELPEHGHEH